MTVVTTAGEEHLAQVLDCWVGAGAEPSSTDDLAALAGLRARDPAALLVALDGGSVVGTLVVGWDGWRGSFYRLAVLPRYRRRGVARALVREGERRLAALGVRRIGLIAVAEHDHATGFWEAQGYRRMDGHARYVKNLGPVTRT